MIKERTGNAVLGIDSAWTLREPSGVALVVQTASGWSCRGLAPSYEQFIALSAGESVNWNQTPRGSQPDFKKLVAAAGRLAPSAHVRVIAVDMPVSLEPITARREADTGISRAFGGRGCAVHSPGPLRPGKIADQCRAECQKLGFHLATAQTPAGTAPSLVEVYPHTAILELLDLDYRFPYKVSRRNRYWRDATVQQRKCNLIESFQRLLAALEKEILGISLEIPGEDDIRTFASLKRFEDALDALVCAWTGKAYLEGDCVAFGDDSAAIWVPVSR